MLRTLLLLTTLGLTLTGISPADDKQPAAPGPLEGAWKLTSVLLNAQALPMEKLQDARLVVRGTKYSLTLADTRLEMKHELLSDQRPWAMDLTIVEGREKGKIFHAIIKLADDTLTVCRSIQPDQERPIEFASKPDSGLLLVVWTRHKAQ